VAFSACTADLTESCLSGPCEANLPPAGSSVASTSATGGTGGAGGAEPACDKNSIPSTGDLPCDVFEVLKARCHECHTLPQMGGAPMSFHLLTFEETQKPFGAGKLWEAMKVDIETGFMPFNKPEDLQGAELATMEKWFAACAPPVPEGMGCEME
jgi:hypothetical protein